MNTLQESSGQVDTGEMSNVADEIQKISSHLKQNPRDADSKKKWFRLAHLYSRIGYAEKASSVYRALLEIWPDCLEAVINLALSQEKLNKPEEALGILASPIAFLDTYCYLLLQRARIEETLGMLDKAEATLLRSLTTLTSISPTSDSISAALQHYLHLRQKQCRWPIIVNHSFLSESFQVENIGSLATLAYTDDPEVLAAGVRTVANRFKTLESKIFKFQKRNPKRKLRIGFLSTDFRWHAVSILAVELFEKINKDKFSTYAFDITNAPLTDFRLRVIRAFEHHVPLQELSDLDAAKKIAEYKLDILIDLNGMTANARPRILKYKPAPVQVSWLGSLTSTGIEEVDYYLTDKYAFLPEFNRFFTEKPLYMKSGAHLNDGLRRIGEVKSRDYYGIPNDKFVYCCFNNSYKINESTLVLWKAILDGVEDSVLWLSEDNVFAKRNILEYAKKNGIGQGRIYFTPKILPEDYLARFKLADLFLDTFPYNAGTIAIDCLYSGLPILTYSGRSVSSRTAGSILYHSNLEELIASDKNDYVNKAIEWGRERESFKMRFGEKLNHLNLLKSPIFNTEAKAREFEALMRSIAI